MNVVLYLLNAALSVFCFRMVVKEFEKRRYFWICFYLICGIMNIIHAIKYIV